MPNDKFILMGLDDERSSNIAEVLKNPTCKKILNLLGDVKEASEKDIAKALGIPINTAEYNLEKLVKSSLVEKAKNFFWSVKGKKIPMYKLARKHIIISPNKNPSLSYVKSILPAILIAAAIIALLLMLPRQQVVETQLKQFSSQQDLNNFIKQRSEVGGFYGVEESMAKAATAPSVSTATGAAEQAGAEDYSTTNIQVEGVDEADIVKNDGKYIYAVSGNKIAIVDAYPAENMKILSEINISDSVGNIFINDDKLIIFANNYNIIPYGTGVVKESVRCLGCGYSESSSIVYIYDVKDRENPELEKEISVDGSYIDSRMIGDYVYVISNKYVNVDNPEPPIYVVNGVKEAVKAQEVYYWDYPDNSYTFTSIMAINVDSGEFNSEVYLTGSTNTIYVSQANIYLTYQKRADYSSYAEEIAEEVYFPIFPKEEGEKIQKVLDSDKNNWEKLSEMQEVVNSYGQSLKNGKDMADFSDELLKRLEKFNEKIQKKLEQTVIHKINVDKDKIEYKGVGEVPGHILNQFSMDEYKGNFRIATTTGEIWQGSSLNNLYVLDENLKIIGSVEDLAKGEKIYSVRFLGDRAYVVTFRQVDPLFVIDLSKPENPEVLGFLKVTGYSSYLHVYDEKNIIGIGMEASEQGRVSGMKIAIFDVSDVKNPVEKTKYDFGKYSSSQALYDHKAFLFDRGKGLLVIPVQIYDYEIQDSWQGVYVLNIDLSGISVRGKISHQENFTKNEWGYVDIDYNRQIQRSLFMDDVLYTVSNAKIKANNLQNIEEISSVDLGYEEEVYPLYETAVSSK